MRREKGVVRNLQEGLNLKKALDIHMMGVRIQPHIMIHSVVLLPRFTAREMEEEDAPKKETLE